MVRWTSALLLQIWLLLGLDAVAVAEEGRATLALRWQLPVDCPDARTIERDVEAILDRDVFARNGESPPSYRLVGRAAAGRVTLSVETVPGGEVLGTRVVEGRPCETMREALGLIVAMLVDLSERHAELHLPAAAAEPATRPEPERRPPRPRRRSPPSRDHARAAYPLSLYVGGGLGAGLHPSDPSLRLGLGLALRLRQWLAFAVGLESGPPAEARDDGGRKVTFGLGGVDLGPCVRAPIARGTWVDTCAVITLGVAVGQGSGFDQADRAPALWLSAGATAGLHLRLAGPVFVDLRGGVRANLVRPGFAYLDAEGVEHELYRVDRVGVRALLSVGIDFFL